MKYSCIITLHILILILWFINVFVWNLDALAILFAFFYGITFFVFGYILDTRDEKVEELECKLNKLQKQLLKSWEGKDND